MEIENLLGYLYIEQRYEEKPSYSHYCGPYLGSESETQAVMAVLNKTPIRIVDGYSCNLPTIEDTQDCGLCKINKTNSTGLTALEAMNVMVKEYPEIMDILKENK